MKTKGGEAVSYQRERIAGLLAAHGYRMLRLRRQASGSHRIAFEPKPGRPGEPASVVARIDLLYAEVFREIDRQHGRP